MASKAKKYPVVVVEWNDAWSCDNSGPLAEWLDVTRPVLRKTVGVLVSQDATGVMVAQTTSEKLFPTDDTEDRENVWFVPASMVVRVRRLGYV